MQTTERIKEQITQGEPLLRQFAVQYFSESYSRDAELLSLVLASCQKPEYTGCNLQLLELAHRLVYTPENVSNLIDIISTDFDSDSAQNNITTVDQEEKPVSQRNHQGERQFDMLTEEERRACQWLLVYAPLPLLEPYHQQMVQLPAELKDTLELRRTLAELSSAALWDKLQEVAKDNKAKSPYQNNRIFNECLIKELISRHELTTEKIPHLVTLLSSEREELIQRAVEALVYIGTEEVVESLLEGTSRQSVGYRLAVSSILGRIKLTVSESAILQLYSKEENRAVQTMLAKGICQLLSIKGIPIVWKQIMEGYDRSKVNLAQYLYANYALNGLEIPSELIAWKEQYDRQQLAQEMGLSGIQEKEELSPFAVRQQQMPIRRMGSTSQPLGKKVGRNEPCPCGSGKKYKKCCGA